MASLEAAALLDLEDGLCFYHPIHWDPFLGGICAYPIIPFHTYLPAPP